jgi:hypothetical protein
LNILLLLVVVAAVTMLVVVLVVIAVLSSDSLLAVAQAQKRDLLLQQALHTPLLLAVVDKAGAATVKIAPMVATPFLRQLHLLAVVGVVFTLMLAREATAALAVVGKSLVAHKLVVRVHLGKAMLAAVAALMGLWQAAVAVVLERRGLVIRVLVVRVVLVTVAMVGLV